MRLLKSLAGGLSALPCLVMAFFMSAAGAAAPDLPLLNEHRVALVIGNSRYAESPLKNPVNDSRAMRAKLEDLGFEVVYFEDLKIRQIGGALREFRSKIKPGSVAAFFYAGHGLQVKGENYLPAVDADLQGEEEVPLQSLHVGNVLNAMAESKSRLNLVLLDACRNNPFTRRFRSAGGGLAKVDHAPSGTLIHFATKPGSVAADGDGSNGLYTQQLLAAIDRPGMAVEQVFKEAARGVRQASKGKQEPWMEGQIEGEFYFRPAGYRVLGKSDRVRDLLRKSNEAYRDRNYQSAIDFAEQLLTLQPTEVAALGNKTVSLLMLGRLDEAADTAEHAIVTNPNYGPSYNNRGIVRERQGHASEAVADFAKGCALGDSRACRNQSRLSDKRTDAR